MAKAKAAPKPKKEVPVKAKKEKPIKAKKEKAPKQPKAVKPKVPKVKSDLYTVVLMLTFFALATACVFIYLNGVVAY